MIKNYKDLLVWQKAMDLATDCYRTTQQFPTTERYGITVQLREAAVSIPANVAEGRGRRTTREFIRYLNIAYGSLSELETHIHLAERLEFAASEVTGPLLAQCDEIGRMINGLRKSLQSRTRSRRVHLNPEP